MIVNLYAMPGDIERVAMMTVTEDVFVGDVLKSVVDVEAVTGTKRWRVIGLHNDEADAVACR